MGIRGRLSLGDTSDDAQMEAAAHTGDLRVSQATAASVCSLRMLLDCMCVQVHEVIEAIVKVGRM